MVCELEKVTYHELCMRRKQNEGMIRSSDPKDHLRLNTIIPGILNVWMKFLDEYFGGICRRRDER